jgi:20S proteasome alpha/beta subunit
MTTIAYKKGIIAYDSRVTNENVIVDDDADKLIIRNDVGFFCTGATSDFEVLIQSYLAGKYVGNGEKVEAALLVLDDCRLFTCAVHEGEFWRSPVRLTNCIAIGSGRDFALAFMDTGMSAKDAVLATMKRDSATGGTIRTHPLSVPPGSCDV